MGATENLELGGGLTLADAARMMREAMKDKGYRAFPLGQDAAGYLHAKRKRLTEASYRDYEGSLDKFVRFFCDLELKDFEPPALIPGDQAIPWGILIGMVCGYVCTMIALRHG